jgi:unsaturated chondroitin disaccharide hydrolase
MILLMKKPQSLTCFNYLALIIVSCLAGCSTGTNSQEKLSLTASAWNAAEVLEKTSGKISDNLAVTNPDKPFPRSIKGGVVEYVAAPDWTSGFYPGTLWYLYAANNQADFRKAAQTWTALLEEEQFNTNDHDIGFQIGSSYGNAYKFTCEEEYLPIILQSARSLTKRFNPKVGAIKSWNPRNGWQYPVIIDNMMNLELLFEATRLSGDSSYYKVAYQHAMTTHENHFRDNSSSYHVINYDSVSGEILSRQTHQGAADSSAWARGQAWGLYGYTMAYRYTQEPVFLQRAKDIAAFIISRSPKNGIPPWDFDLSKEEEHPTDASAAAITASALLELQLYDQENSETYKKSAENILRTLSEAPYLLAASDATPFIIDRSTGHKPHNSEINVPINYADYYFVEGLYRFSHLGEQLKKTFAYGNCK